MTCFGEYRTTLIDSLTDHYQNTTHIIIIQGRQGKDKQSFSISFISIVFLKLMPNDFGHIFYQVVVYAQVHHFGF